MIRVLADGGGHGKVIRPEELSMYESPCPRSRFIPQPPGLLEETLRAGRLSVETHATWVSPLAHRISSATKTVVTTGVDFYELLRSPPSTFYPRLGIIAGSGLLGFTLALRGERWRRILYPGIAIALASSVCYPEESVHLAQVGGEKVVSLAVAGVSWGASLWKSGPPKPLPTPASLTPPPAAGGGGASENLAQTPPPLVGFSPDPRISDHGQSHPGDKDLYSTRGQQ